MLYLENSHRDFLDVIVNYTGIQLLYITMQYNCRQISIFCYLARLYVSWIHRGKLKETQKKHRMFDNNNENLIRKTVIHNTYLAIHDQGKAHWEKGCKYAPKIASAVWKGYQSNKCVIFDCKRPAPRNSEFCTMK